MLSRPTKKISQSSWRTTRPANLAWGAAGERSKVAATTKLKDGTKGAQQPNSPEKGIIVCIRLDPRHNSEVLGRRMSPEIVNCLLESSLVIPRLLPARNAHVYSEHGSRRAKETAHVRMLFARKHTRICNRKCTDRSSNKVDKRVRISFPQILT